MAVVKPWEEVPDDGYWRALLGGTAGQPSGRGEDASPSPSAPSVPLASNPVGNAADVVSADAPTRPVAASWALAEKSYAQGETLELRVVGYNRGGLLVDLGEVRGFVPASQLIAFLRHMQEDERMEELARYMNTLLRLKVIEFDRAHNRVILSERVANSPISRAEQVLATLEPHQTRKGTIRNVTDFGAFVDLGGVEGLIHVSEFSWQHVAHPRDLLTPGQAVQVYIMDVNREQKRIACSLKRLTPNPWAEIAEKVHPGDQIEGVITNVVTFGAFVRVAEYIEGLIHISELAEGSFLHPRDVVQEGQTVRARVLSIDPVRQRIALSLRNGLAHAAGSPESADFAQSPSGAVVPNTAPASARSRVSYEEAPPPPPDPGYWESLAQSGA